jgi:hypothetical protein
MLLVVGVSMLSWLVGNIMQTHQDPPQLVLGVELIIHAPCTHFASVGNVTPSNPLFIAFILFSSYLLHINHELNLNKLECQFYRNPTLAKCEDETHND